MLHKIRPIFALMLLLTSMTSFTVAAYAQEPWEDPASGEERIDRKRGQLKEKSSPALPEQIQIMGRRLTGLMDFLQSEVVAFFTTWVERLAQILAGGILLFSLLNKFRETNAAANEHLFWWFVRLGICLGLLGSGPWLINYMYDIGKDVAIGQSANSVPFKFYDRLQTNFTESYAKIAQNNFKVRVPGEREPFAVKPVDSTEMFLGVLEDQQGTVRDFNNHLTNSTWLLPRLYAWLGLCRSFLEGADLWLMILSFILLMAFKVAAPVMIAVAIDRSLAQRMSYPFLWGGIVLTLIWPTVSYVIRGLAYLAGNTAMALGDSAPVYVWNEATAQYFRSMQSQPVYTVFFACFTMSIAAICLWLSPVIAYQISVGRIYEGVSHAASSAAGMVSGLAAELYGANVAARYSQEAAKVQAQGSYDSQTTIAGGERRAADIAAKAAQQKEHSQVEASRIGQLSATYANLGFQRRSIEADRTSQIVGNQAQARLTNRNIAAGLTRDQEENRISTRQQIQNSGADAAGSVYSIGGGALGSIVGGAGGANPIGAAVGSYFQLTGNEKRMDMHQEASLEAQKLRNANLQNLAGSQQQNQEMFAIEMNANTNRRAASLDSAAQVSAAQTAGGINRSATIQLGGIDRSAEMQLDANKVRYDAQVQAADITRGAAMEAMRLHAMESIVRSVSSKIARDIEGSMVLRY